MEWHVSHPNELTQIANYIYTKHRFSIFLLEGEMGSGKTTLTKELIKAFGGINSSSSPTFSIVNEIATADKKTLFHFDLYRLKHLEEALDIGIEEYLDKKNSYSFIEWPEIITPLIPEKFHRIHITKKAGNNRLISFT